MSQPEWYQPRHQPLTEAQTNSANEELLIKFPKIVRNQQDNPIPNQENCTFSFMVFSEPKEVRVGNELKGKIYGYVKNRGNFANSDAATSHSEEIIKSQDSRHPIFIGQTGTWYPITDNEQMCSDLLDVEDSRKEVQLRDRATKEKEQKERERMREIHEHMEDLKKHDTYDDPDTLEFYTTKRNTEIRLSVEVRVQQRRLENTIKKLETTRRLLKKLELRHPTYNGEWIEYNNSVRRERGIPEFVPSEDQFVEYEATHFDDLDDDISDYFQSGADPLNTI